MLKKLKAALGNSIVWGVAWAAGSVILATLFTWLGIVSVPLNAAELVQIATWYGVVGVVAGGAFSSVLPIAFRGRDVLGVGSLLFLGAGATAGIVLAPMLPGPIWIAVILGASTSGGTLAMAKSAARRELDAEGRILELPHEVSEPGVR